MSNFELQLNSRIIREGKAALAVVLDYGIGLADYRTHEGKAMFQHLLAYYNDSSLAGSLPGVQSAKHIFPSFDLCDDASMSTEKLCEEIRKNRQVIEGREIASRLAEMLELNPQTALGDAMGELTQLIALGTSRKTDVPIEDVYDEILFDYEMAESGVDLSVCSWPWPSLQRETMGLQKDDYVVFYGRPKSKKSWVLAYCIAHAYLQGKSIVVYTKEMTPKNIYKRVAACLARIPYRELRQGKLSVHDRATLFALRDYIQDMRHSQRFIVLSAKDAGPGGDTVPWFRSKIEKYKPNVQFVDGLYLMAAVNGSAKQADHARVQSISRDYRQLILDTGIPGICTLQANRKAAGHANAELDEIAFSDAIGQDATLASRVIAEKGNSIAIVLGGSREFELQGIRIGGLPAVDFEEREELTEKEILKAKEKDGNGDDVEKASTQTKPRKMSSEANKLQDALLEKQLNGMA